MGTLARQQDQATATCHLCAAAGAGAGMCHIMGTLTSAHPQVTIGSPVIESTYISSIKKIFNWIKEISRSVDNDFVLGFKNISIN